MKAIRVLLVNAGRKTTTVRAISPPIGLLYLAAFVRKDPRVQVKIIDQRAENCPSESIVERARALEPDLVGFRALSSDAHFLNALVDDTRQALPQAKVVVGGPHASAIGSTLLEKMPADAVVLGEGERSFQMIVEALLEGSCNFQHVPGLVWRDAAGEIIANPGRPPLIEDLDALPFPAYDLLDLPLYWRAHGMAVIPIRRYLSLFSSRGCPFLCNYCHNIFGKQFRAHSAERVADEIEYFGKKFGVKSFEFLDDVFNFNAARVIALSDLVRKRNLRIKVAFPNALRTDILTAETVDALAAMGTYFSSFALETGSPRLQKLIGKNLNIPRYLEGVRMMAKHRIFTNGFAMMGFPTETEDEMQATIDVVCQSKLHSAAFFAVTPYPMTKLYQDAAATQPEKLAGLGYNDTDYRYNLAINLSAVPDHVLVAYLKKAYRRFFGNPIRALRIIRDYPAPTQLPILFRGLFILSTKKSMKKPVPVLRTPHEGIG